MVTSLNGKRALVTGAASGIGHAAFEALRAAGARCIGLDFAPHGEDMVLCDLAEEAQIVRAVAVAAKQLGRVDILVNNAGIMREAALKDVTAADIDRHFAINVRGAILVAREVLKVMGPGGRIINTASELAYLGRANASVYVATKAAILGLTRSWARELAPDILVNAVAPGPTDTPLLGFDAMTDAQKAQELENPLRRIGRSEEVAAAILFLASPQASFITGHCLGVNGGAAMV